jgi:hypothetical protein
MCKQRWIFRLQIPLCAISLVMIPIFLDMRFKTKMTVASVKKDLKAFDWIGLTSFVVSFTLILVAISMGEEVIYPWGDWKIITIFAIGFVSAIAFTVYEAFVPKIPFLALALFNNLAIAVTFLGTFIHGYILWSLLLYLPLYYEAVKDLAPTQSGLAVFPESLTVAPTSLIVGILVAKTGKFKSSRWVLTTLGTGLLLLLDVNTSTPAWVGINQVVGLGTGMLFSGDGVLDTKHSHGNQARPRIRNCNIHILPLTWCCKP